MKSWINKILAGRKIKSLHKIAADLNADLVIYGNAYVQETKYGFKRISPIDWKDPNDTAQFNTPVFNTLKQHKRACRKKERT